MNSLVKPQAQFTKGDVLRLKRDRMKIGVVLAMPFFSERGWKYEILIDNEVRIIAEAELVPYDQAAEVQFGDAQDLLRNLVLLKLRQPLADNLYAAYASRTKFEVYQFKPALKFLSNPDQRLLIADEVGLGKTIEAGIIFLELQARMDLARVLIICPSVLRIKWRDEMRSRFDENFTVLDTGGLRDFLSNYAKFRENERLKGIVSLELIRGEEFANALNELDVQFDLVIVDEAHHCRNTDTHAHQIVAHLADRADAMLFLTATPLHLGNADLFNLLKILSPSEFDNFEAFEQRLSPNRFINEAGRQLDQGKITEAMAQLRKVEETPERQRYRANPYYNELCKSLSHPSLNAEEMVAAKRQLLDLNTLAHIFTRTRKREVLERAPERTPSTYYVDFTPSERKFYQKVIQFVREQFSSTGGGWASGFAVIMRERQVASCISAMREHIEELLGDQYSDKPEDEDTTQWVVPEGYGEALLPTQRSAARDLLRAGRAVGETDSKFDVFQSALQENFAKDPTSKVLVFSFFRNTLDYLYGRLRHLGYKVRMIHGGMGVLDRQQIIEEFHNQADIRILLSSEVGSEGLDFQFCNTVFNYDLPWNPMKVEQRIGRLDRFGQESPRIKIINLVIRDSIEERIFLRLYERIGIFKESIGDLEAILGDEIRNLSQMVFTRDLSAEEEKRLADQAAEVIERRKQAMEDFEKKKLEFMGQDVIFANDIKNAIDSGHYVSEGELQALVGTYLTKFPKSRLESNNDAISFSLYADAQLVEELQDFALRSRGRDQRAQDFLRRLRPNAVIPITFSAIAARERKLVEFITIRHLLVRAARQFWEAEPRDPVPMANVVLSGRGTRPGLYYFFVFLFESRGLDESTTLFPVVVSAGTNQIDSEMSTCFLRLVQQAPPERADRARFDPKCFGQAEETAKAYAATESDHRLDELQRLNDSLISARLSALRQTFEIKQQTVTGYVQAATEPRIQRMRKSQLQRIRANYNAKVRTLEEKRKVSLDFKLSLAGMARVDEINEDIPSRDVS